MEDKLDKWTSDFWKYFERLLNQLIVEYDAINEEIDRLKKHSCDKKMLAI
ncbi:MAG: hypothetical protein ACUVRS_09080 [Armatimonadota bacterium]